MTTPQKADLLEIMMSSPELMDAVYERVLAIPVVTTYRIIQETLAVLVELGLISHESGYQTAPCNCENSYCESGTHSVAEDSFTRCPGIGSVLCEYIGSICPTCAEYMPARYLNPVSPRA